jgi:hypothetical protein
MKMGASNEGGRDKDGYETWGREKSKKKPNTTKKTVASEYSKKAKDVKVDIPLQHPAAIVKKGRAINMKVKESSTKKMMKSRRIKGDSQGTVQITEEQYKMLQSLTKNLAASEVEEMAEEGTIFLHLVIVSCRFWD